MILVYTGLEEISTKCINKRDGNSKEKIYYC